MNLMMNRSVKVEADIETAVSVAVSAAEGVESGGEMHEHSAMVVTVVDGKRKTIGPPCDGMVEPLAVDVLVVLPLVEYMAQVAVAHVPLLP
jgi:hypothetical protein